MAARLVSRLRAELRTALKARDAAATAALRTTLAALDNATAVDATGSAPRPGLYSNEVARQELDDDEAATIVATQVDELRDAAQELAGLDQHARAEALQAQAALLQALLGANAPGAHRDGSAS